MNGENTSNQGLGNGIVFLIGAMYNILAGLDFSSLVDHAVRAIVGGLAFLLVQAIWNALKPSFKKLKNRVVKLLRELIDER